MQLGKRIVKIASAIAISCGVVYNFHDNRFTRCFWNNPQTTQQNTENQEKTSMWVWGNGLLAPQSDFRASFANFTPKQKKVAVVLTKNSQKLEKNLPHFKNIIFEDKKAVAIDSLGKIFRFDNFELPSFRPANSEIEIEGQKLNPDEVIFNLEDISLPDKAKKIGVTKKFVWGLSEKGALYTFPVEQMTTQRTKPEWRLVKNANKLQDVSFGTNHLLMLDKNGDLFAMGDDTFGQCGVTKQDRKIETPLKEVTVFEPEKVSLPSDVKVQRIFSKSNFNYVISSKNEVFCFGQNNHMQLGFESEFASFLKTTAMIPKPRSFQSYITKSNCELQDIVLGQDFAFFHCINSKTKRTEVFGMGSNLKGRLALPEDFPLAHFELVDELSNLAIETEDGEEAIGIKKITCGNAHCIASFSVQGLNLIWGENERGQLGNQSNFYTFNPKVLTTFKKNKILEVIADKNSTYILSD